MLKTRTRRRMNLVAVMGSAHRDMADHKRLSLRKMNELAAAAAKQKMIITQLSIVESAVTAYCDQGPMRRVPAKQSSRPLDKSTQPCIVEYWPIPRAASFRRLGTCSGHTSSTPPRQPPSGTKQIMEWPSIFHSLQQRVRLENFPTLGQEVTVRTCTFSGGTNKGTKLIHTKETTDATTALRSLLRRLRACRAPTSTAAPRKQPPCKPRLCIP